MRLNYASLHGLVHGTDLESLVVAFYPFIRLYGLMKVISFVIMLSSSMSIRYCLQNKQTQIPCLDYGGSLVLSINCSADGLSIASTIYRKWVGSRGDEAVKERLIVERP